MENAISFYKLKVVKEKEVPYECSKAISGPDKIAQLAFDYIGLDEFPEEHLYLIALNIKNYVLGIAPISHGILNASMVHPREVFKYALSVNAASIILLHNHPSGDVTPSNEDVGVTKRVQEAGELMGVSLLDHVIVAEGKFLSLKEKGYI